MSKLNDFATFRQKVGSNRWPVTKFWTTFSDAEKKETPMATNEDIINILRSSPYNEHWIDDNDFSVSSRGNSDFQKAIDENNIEYFEYCLNHLFKDGWSAKTKPQDEKFNEQRPEPQDKKFNEQRPEPQDKEFNEQRPLPPMKTIREKNITILKTDGKKSTINLLNPSVKFEKEGNVVNIDEIKMGETYDLIWNNNRDSFLSSLGCNVTKIEPITERQVVAGGKRRTKKTTKRKTKGKNKRKTKGKKKTRKSRRKL